MINVAQKFVRLAVILIVAAIVCATDIYQLDAAERISIGKRYEGGVEFTARPNIMIAQWKMTIDTITTEQTLYYRGERPGQKICVESRIVERNSRTMKENRYRSTRSNSRLIARATWFTRSSSSPFPCASPKAI